MKFILNLVNSKLNPENIDHLSKKKGEIKKSQTISDENIKNIYLPIIYTYDVQYDWCMKSASK